MPNLLDALKDRDFLKAVYRGLTDAANRGMVAGTLGAPVDMATQAANLGVAGVGYLGHKTGVFKTAPELIDLRNVPGSSEWIGQKMQNAGIVSENRNPVAEAGMGLLSPVAYMGAQKAGKALYQAEQNAAKPSTLANSKQRGIFAGEWAKTADKAKLKAAQAMETKQADPRDIWNQTGWFKGPDGKWRFEIDDSLAGMRLLQPKFADGSRGQVLSEVLDHKGVFKAYPDSQQINVNFSDVADGGGYSQPRSWAEYIDVPRATGRGAQAHPDTTRSVMLHELQHAIQGREGFAKGGSPESVRSDALDMLRRDVASGAIGSTEEAMSMLPMAQANAYRRLMGEVEARAVQARMGLSATQRKSLFPLDSYDVPIDSLIIRAP